MPALSSSKIYEMVRRSNLWDIIDNTRGMVIPTDYRPTGNIYRLHPTQLYSSLNATLAVYDMVIVIYPIIMADRF